MKLTKETYYAIRIGNQPRPCFKLSSVLATPMLFTSKRDAVEHLIPGFDEKVIRVELRELK